LSRKIGHKSLGMLKYRNFDMKMPIGVNAVGTKVIECVCRFWQASFYKFVREKERGKMKRKENNVTEREKTKRKTDRRKIY
jgi:hypothetical protein